MERIAADLREHYWYDELVNETIEQIEDYLALRAAVQAGLDRPSSSPASARARGRA